MAWSPKGDEIYAATDEIVVALRVGDGRRRVLLRDTGLGCSGDFNCGMFIRAVSSEGHHIVVEADGGTKKGSALIALSTDGRQRTQLPYATIQSGSIHLP